MGDLSSSQAENKQLRNLDIYVEKTGVSNRWSKNILVFDHLGAEVGWKSEEGSIKQRQPGIIEVGVFIPLLSNSFVLYSSSHSLHSSTCPQGLPWSGISIFRIVFIRAYRKYMIRL